MDRISIDRARITDKGVELKTSKQGKPYATFSVMWSSSRKNQQNDQWEHGPTKFLGVTMFGTAAEAAAELLSPKDTVALAGKIEHFEWQSNQGPRDDWKMLADHVTLVRRGQSAAQPDAWNSAPKQADPFAQGDTEPPF